MAELLYTTLLINQKDEILTEIHSQRYSMGFLDFCFTENDKEFNFQQKHWVYKINATRGIKNAQFYLNKFRERYNKNKKNGLYIDEKNEKEIAKDFDFFEEKISLIQQYQSEFPDDELFLYADLSEVTFMFDMERDIPFGENRKKQEKYMLDLVDGAFSEQLETKEMILAKSKLKELRTALLRQARIIYIPELEEDPTIWHFNNHILIRAQFVVQVYEKPLLDTPQHNEIIQFAIKAIEPSLESRNVVIEYSKEESIEYLKDGKLLITMNMLHEWPVE